MVDTYLLLLGIERFPSLVVCYLFPVSGGNSADYSAFRDAAAAAVLRGPETSNNAVCLSVCLFVCLFLGLALNSTTTATYRDHSRARLAYGNDEAQKALASTHSHPGAMATSHWFELIHSPV